MRHIFVDASSRHVVFSTRHHGVFSCFISVSRHASPFFKGVIKKFRIVNFKLMKTCFNAETHSQCGRSNSPLSAQRSFSPPCWRPDQPNPSPPGGHLPLLLTVKFTPCRSAVFLHPCFPVCRQIHPSPTPSSRHPPPLISLECDKLESCDMHEKLF